MADLNTNDAIWMADLPGILSFDIQVGAELEEASIDVEDVDEVESHNMNLKEAKVDYVVIPRLLSSLVRSTSPSNSKYDSFSNNSNLDSTSFAHITDPWHRYMLNLPYNPAYNGSRPHHMMTYHYINRT